MSEQKQQSACKNKSINNERKTRYEKLSALRERNMAFPNNFYRNAMSDKLHAIYDKKNHEELEILNVEVSVAGRMMNRRIFGKSSFVTLQDMGGRIQLYLSQGKLSDEIYNEHFKKWDIGDILGARGKLFKTKTEELSIYCTEIYLLTKSLRPLPEKFHGLVDQEICYRQRYLDLITNHESRNIFKMRSKIVTNIRNFMINRDFIEVETPMMQLIPGGASARPFITHHNSLNIDMYLRIAPELYLKRLVIGGFERVFEINRNFRNEGISPYHNPEFTMMEIYMAYANYIDMAVMVENLFRDLITKVLNSETIFYGDYLIDFSKPFEKFTMREAIKTYLPEINITELDDFDKVLDIAHSLCININNNWGRGRVLTEIFKSIAEKRLIQPTFITEYPAEVSPLARCDDKNPDIAERFEFFIGGHEIGNGFSELNDADEQAKRFWKQLSLKDRGDDEAMFYDEDYITALEYGLPPTAGVGLGIDRMMMIFTNKKSIRDVILFPTLKPISQLKDNK